MWVSEGLRLDGHSVDYMGAFSSAFHFGSYKVEAGGSDVAGFVEVQMSQRTGFWSLGPDRIGSQKLHNANP